MNLIDLHYILVGKEVRKASTLLEWARCFENSEGRRVAKTQLEDCWVSTVFLGLDHNYSGRGPPILFETMVFGGALDQDMWRCSTYAQAEVQHEEVVRACRKAALKVINGGKL